MMAITTRSSIRVKPGRTLRKHALIPTLLLRFLVMGQATNGMNPTSEESNGHTARSLPPLESVPGGARATQSVSGKLAVLVWALTSNRRPESSGEAYFSGIRLLAVAAALAAIF